eukprot:Nk52_evm46s1360 gene=Nk52_evmTU46s1360
MDQDNGEEEYGFEGPAAKTMYTVVMYPGLVRHPEEAIRTLGGSQRINHVINTNVRIHERNIQELRKKHDLRNIRNRQMGQDEEEEEEEEEGGEGDGEGEGEEEISREEGKEGGEAGSGPGKEAVGRVTRSSRLRKEVGRVLTGDERSTGQNSTANEIQQLLPLLLQYRYKREASNGIRGEMKPCSNRLLLRLRKRRPKKKREREGSERVEGDGKEDQEKSKREQMTVSIIGRVGILYDFHRNLFDFQFNSKQDLSLNCAKGPFASAAADISTFVPHRTASQQKQRLHDHLQKAPGKEDAGRGEGRGLLVLDETAKSKLASLTRRDLENVYNLENRSAKGDGGSELMEEEAFEFLPLRWFGCFKQPVDYNYKNTSSDYRAKQDVNSSERERKKDKLQVMTVPFLRLKPIERMSEGESSITEDGRLDTNGNATIPSQPRKNMPPVTNELMPAVEKLKELFSSNRKIWPKMLLSKLFSESELKQICGYVAYRAFGGPFDKSYIALGVDPRTSPTYGIYQVVDIRVPRKNCLLEIEGEEQAMINVHDPERKPELFTEDTIPLRQQSQYALTDIKIGDVHNIVMDADNILKTYNTKTGWYHAHTISTIKQILKEKIRRNAEVRTGRGKQSGTSSEDEESGQEETSTVLTNEPSTNTEFGQILSHTGSAFSSLTGLSNYTPSTPAPKEGIDGKNILANMEELTFHGDVYSDDGDAFEVFDGDDDNDDYFNEDSRNDRAMSSTTGPSSSNMLPDSRTIEDSDESESDADYDTSDDSETGLDDDSDVPSDDD